MTVTPWITAAFLAASALALAPSGSFAQATSPAEDSATVVEPGSVAALGKMSAYLRSVHGFQVTMSTQQDDVDVDGQIITLNGATTYKVRSPDGFNIQVDKPGKTRTYVYDGKSVTVYDPKTNYYAHFPAPPTTRQTLDAAEKFGVSIPLDDLFHWDQGDAQTSELTSGHYVGPAKLGGQEAEQYAFRQPGRDWQIWIAKGDRPTPLRVVIVASDDPDRPQFQADLSWDIDPQFPADTFVFTPPAGAKDIPIQATLPEE